MTTNEHATDESIDTQPGERQRVPVAEIDSTFTTDVADDAYTNHIEPIAKATHRWDHRRTTYVYARHERGLVIQARYALHGDLKHVYEHTLDIGDESPLEHARRSWDRNPTASLGEEFESAVGCARPLHLRWRDWRDRVTVRAKSALAAALPGV